MITPVGKRSTKSSTEQLFMSLPQEEKEEGEEVLTIVLADDHHIVRQGLKSLLDAEPDFKIVGDTGSGQEAMRMVESLQPNILVLDLVMGDVNGLEVTEQVAQRSPKTSIIILSMYGNEGYVLQALQAGAKAYVLKEAPSDELLHAIHEVSAGHRYLSTPLSERAIEAYVQRSQATAQEPYDTLTSRERQVLQLVFEGNTNTEVADRLYISPRTVEVHRANMMRKLGIENQTQLIYYIMQRGLLLPGI
ncbi:response regulator [Chloroflexota bacterium]